MIIEWLLGLTTWLGTMIIGMVPENDAAELVDTSSNVIADVISMGNGITVWFPWTVVGVCLAATYSAWAALFALKIVRQLIAHIPQIGGTG